MAVLAVTDDLMLSREIEATGTAEEALGEQALLAGCKKVFSKREFAIELPRLMRTAG